MRAKCDSAHLFSSVWRLRQENLEFKVNLGYIVTFYLKSGGGK
jgi:hypothetical protein